MKIRRPRSHRKYVLAGLITSRGWRFGAELGVFRGDTFLHLLRQCPTLRLIGVDTWQADPSKDEFRSVGGRSYAQHPLGRFHAELREALARENLSARAMLWPMTTAAAAPVVPDRALDFVFVDADHTYEGVRRDLTLWTPKIKPGGMVLGHDYNAAVFPGVVKAVDETFGPPQLFADHVWGVPVP